MSVVAGVDGARGGWIMVRHDRARGLHSVHQAAAWRDLPVVDLVAVDMPIGLPDSGARLCDLPARRHLGATRGASVFLGLRRPLLAFATYPEANAWAKADGSGLAKQAWFLLPKIRELDRALCPADQDRVRESHPELVFWRLNGDRPVLPGKRTEEGARVRRRLLRRAGIGLAPLLRALDRRLAAEDDLLDAAALAWAAGRFHDGAGACFSAGAARDARGLRMEIWY